MQQHQVDREAPPLVYTLNEFLQAARISRSMFYKIPPDQRPRARLIGNKTVITCDDGRAWISDLPLATWNQKRAVNERKTADAAGVNRVSQMLVEGLRR